MLFDVSYRTPTAHKGSAVVKADGIFSARSEALDAIQILTGHPVDLIHIRAVAEHPSGRTLWNAEEDHEH